MQTVPEQSAPSTADSAAMQQSPPTGSPAERAAEHQKAAMLAEFNGTYELARLHRDLADRLRREAVSSG